MNISLSQTPVIINVSLISGSVRRRHQLPRVCLRVAVRMNWVEQQPNNSKNWMEAFAENNYFEVIPNDSYFVP